MVVLRETGRACGLAAAIKGAEDPEGSGYYLPDEVMGNVSKLNICNAFWRVMALAGDIGGGLVVTMPSIKDRARRGHLARRRPGHGPENNAPAGGRSRPGKGPGQEDTKHRGLGPC